MSDLSTQIPFEVDTPKNIKLTEPVRNGVSEANIAEALLPSTMMAQLDNVYISITSEMFEAGLFKASILGAEFNQTHVKLKISISWLMPVNDPSRLVVMRNKDQVKIETEWRKLMAVCSYPLYLYSDEEISGLRRAGENITRKHLKEEGFKKEDFPKVRPVGGGDFVFLLGDSYKGGVRITKICLGTPEQRSFFDAGMGATPVNGIIERTEERPIIKDGDIYNPDTEDDISFDLRTR